MDKKALLKVLITALIAGGTVAGGQYITSDTVSLTAVANAILVAVLAYLKQSPLEKK